MLSYILQTHNIEIRLDEAPILARFEANSYLVCSSLKVQLLSLAFFFVELQNFENLPHVHKLSNSFLELLLVPYDSMYKYPLHFLKLRYNEDPAQFHVQ